MNVLIGDRAIHVEMILFHFTNLFYLNFNFECSFLFCVKICRLLSSGPAVPAAGPAAPAGEGVGMVLDLLLAYSYTMPQGGINKCTRGDRVCTHVPIICKKVGPQEYDCPEDWMQGAPATAPIVPKDPGYFKPF
eukprot:g73006.t1